MKEKMVHDLMHAYGGLLQMEIFGEYNEKLIILFLINNNFFFYIGQIIKSISAIIINIEANS